MRLLILIFMLAALPFYSLWAAGKIKLDGIKGEDDRILIEKYKYPWSAIGRINKESGGFCTGTLIGPKLVLTAAHCLWNKKRKVWVKPHTVHFLAGYRRGSFIEHAKAVTYHIAPGYSPKAAKTYTSVSKDWAFLELDKDMSKLVGTLAVAPINKNIYTALKAQKTNFIQAGYSQDKAHILSVNQQCELTSYNKLLRLATHVCDAVPGDSGSPIFYKDKTDGLKIGFIHVATAKKKKAQGIAVSGAAIVAHLKTLGFWEQAEKAHPPTQPVAAQ